MRPLRMVRRVGQLMLGLAPLLAGCLAGYAYPKISYVPSLDVEAPPLHVRAFAVGAQSEQQLSLPASNQITLRPLPQEKSVGPQVDVSLEHGYWLWGGLRISEHVSHRLLVRLYRGGHRTIEVGSWQLFEPVRWARAQTLAEMEQAIDDLLAPPRDSDARDGLVSFDHLAPGSTNPRHREALQFGVGEYEAVAKIAGNDEAARTRLLDKARRLRERAEK